MSKVFCKMFVVEFLCYMLVGILIEGYVGCCVVIVGMDFYMFISGLRLLILGILGSEDVMIFVDLVCEMIDFIFGL